MPNIHINGRNICNKTRQLLHDKQQSSIRNIDKTALLFNVTSRLNDIRQNTVNVIFTYFLLTHPIFVSIWVNNFFRDDVPKIQSVVSFPRPKFDRTVATRSSEISRVYGEETRVLQQWTASCHGKQPTEALGQLAYRQTGRIGGWMRRLHVPPPEWTKLSKQGNSSCLPDLIWNS